MQIFSLSGLLLLIISNRDNNVYFWGSKDSNNTNKLNFLDFLLEEKWLKEYLVWFKRSIGYMVETK